MPDPVPTPPAPAPNWKQKYGPIILKVVLWLVGIGMGALASYLGIQAPPPLIVQVPADPTPNEFAAKGIRDYTPTMGWVRDQSSIEANADPLRTMQFSETDAGKFVMGDEDVFLWQAVRKINNKGPPWYPNVNQLNVGCCVGCGFKHCADIAQAMQIIQGKRADWKPLSVEVIYGGSRVEVGGGRISGDGSVGAWAAKWIKDYGVAPMEKYGDIDLTTFSPARARDFGKRGVADVVEKVAKEHPVKGTAIVKSWTDVKRAIQQGYPVAVCSDQGFRMERDGTGRARPQGSWAHCMAIIGVRSGPNEGGFILNSWGDDAHTGPVWPADAPVAGFWADASVIDRMVKQGDSFALSDMVGFPHRDPKPDWFIKAAPRPELVRPLDLFAFTEARIAW
jgi:hypothetical protein